MLRRLKKEVEKSLPPKEETILFTGEGVASSPAFGCWVFDVLGGLHIVPSDAISSGERFNKMSLRKTVEHRWLVHGDCNRPNDPMIQ